MWILITVLTCGEPTSYNAFDMRSFELKQNLKIFDVIMMSDKIIGEIKLSPQGQYCT